MTTYNLTPLEKKFCGALADALDRNMFGDADWSNGQIAGADHEGNDTYDTSLCGPEDIEWEGSKQQLGGLLQSLNKKGVVIVEERIMEYPKLVNVSRHRAKIITEKKRFVDIWGIAEGVRALAD